MRWKGEVRRPLEAVRLSGRRCVEMRRNSRGGAVSLLLLSFPNMPRKVMEFGREFPERNLGDFPAV